MKRQLRKSAAGILLAILLLYPLSLVTAQPAGNGMPELLPDGSPVPPGPYLKGSSAQNQLSLLAAPLETRPASAKPWGTLTSLLINKVITEFGAENGLIYTSPREWPERTLNLNSSPAWYVKNVPANDIQYTAQVLDLDYSLTGSVTLRDDNVLVSDLNLFSASDNKIIKTINITGGIGDPGEFILNICREILSGCGLEDKAFEKLELNTALADIKIAPAFLKALERYRGTQSAYSATWRELFIKSRTGLTAANLLESYRNYNPGSALQLIDQAGLEHTSDILTWRTLIKILNDNNNHERALKELQAFIEQYPDYPPIYDDLITAYTGLGSHTKALASAMRLSQLTGRSYYAETRKAESAIKLAWQLRGRGPYQSVNAVGRKSFPALVKYADAILKDAVDINPVTGMVWEQTLLCYCAQEAPARKISAAYNKVKELSPANIIICRDYIQHYLPLWLNDLEKGWEICRDILNRFPKRDEAAMIAMGFMNDWADLKEDLDNADEYKNKNFTDKLAIVHQHLLRLEPDNCRIKINYAAFRHRTGAYEEAMSLYKKIPPECLRGQKVKLRNRYNIGIAETALALGDYAFTIKSAQRGMELALANENEMMRCRQLLAAAYEASGRYDLAADLWLKVLEQETPYPEARLNFINCALEIESADYVRKAESVAHELIGEDSRNPDYHLAMARINSRRGNRESALKYLKSAIWLDKRNKSYPEQYVVFSEEAYAVKKYEEALSLTATGLKFEQSDDIKFRAERITALSYYGLNEFEKAADAWKRALNINNDSQEARDNLIRAYNRTDNTREIKRLEKEMKQRLETNPGSAWDYMNLALLHYRLKRNKPALEAIDTAISLDKSNKEYRNLKKRMEERENLWPELK